MTAARALQRARFSRLPTLHANAQMTAEYMEPFCPLTPPVRALLQSAMERLSLSARAEQHRVGTTAQRQGRRRQSVAVQVDGRATEERGCQLEVVPELRRDRFEDAHGFRRHVRADAVASEYRDQRLHRWRCS